MKLKIIILFILVICFTSCTTTKYITIPLTPPPAFYTPNKNIKTQKDFIKEYQNSLIHIKKWQYWYDIQINTNYFYSNKN